MLLQEEMLWLQKSRNDWLKAGDDNAKFFHTLTLVRKRRNRIEALKNEDGVWVDRKEQLKSMAVNFYSSLFTVDPAAGVSSIQGASQL